MFIKCTARFIKILSLLAIFIVLGFAVAGLVIFISRKNLGIIYGITIPLSIALVSYILYKFSDKKYQWIWIALIAVGTLIKIAYAIIAAPEIGNDQLVCLQAAEQAANGSFLWTSIAYFERWAFQIPFVLYEAVILKIFGAVRALYIFNGIFSTVICLLIYLIVNKIYGKNTALITAAIYSCFPETVYRIGLLYNYQISGTFFLLAVYFFVNIYKACDEKESVSIFSLFCYSLLIGLFFGISNLFRTEAVIGFLGIECWFIYYFILNFKKNDKKLFFNIILYMIGTYIAFKAVNMVVDFSVIHACISPNGIKNGCPYWYIVCGLTPDNYGMYSTTYNYIIHIKDKNEQIDAFRKIIYTIFSTQSFSDIFSFFIHKLYFMWGKVYYLCYFDNDTIGLSKITRCAFLVFNHAIYTITFFLALIGLRKKQFNNFIAFISIVFIGFFMVYILKEISVMYRTFTIFTVTLLSSSGIDYLCNRKKQKNNEVNNNEQSR